jgi:nitrous oxide reductase accessory protein NosL
MRRFLTLATSLVLAGCATAPTPEQPAPIPPSEHTRGEIVGMTAEQLVGHFGTPALQIREGESLKLQFRSPQCVLDAYLYPNGSSGYRATYVDTRTPGLAPIDQALCIRSLEAR